MRLYSSSRREEALYSLISTGNYKSGTNGERKRRTFRIGTILIGSFLCFTLLLSLIYRPLYSIDGWTKNESCVSDFSLSQRLDSVSCHYQQAKARASIFESNQPIRYEDFIKDYKNRYQRSPPGGLQDWFRFAKESGSKNIIYYDNIYANLAQFQGYAKEDLRTLFGKTKRGDPFATFRIEKGKFVFPNESENKHIYHQKEIVEIFSQIEGLLPDMEFSVNLGDKDMLYGPAVIQSNVGRNDMSLSTTADIKWSLLTKGCPTQYIGNTSLNLDRPSIDVCKHLNSSTFTRLKGAELLKGVVSTTDPIPVFSWSKYSTSRDFLVPIFDYSSPTTRKWEDGEDPYTFEQKNDTLFWRASTTGSLLKEENWYTNHRIQVGQYFNDVRATLLRLEEQKRNPNQLDLRDINLEDTKENRKLLTNIKARNFDAGLSRMVQCEMPDEKCSKVGQLVSLLEPVTGVNRERRSKIVFDMDGNSMSGRFYRMLESNSLVFKQTLLAEWHDDFLIPWFHYIPIDGSSLQQIVQLTDFFLNDRKGKQIATEIAANGSRVAKSMLRNRDFSVYWARLLLEYHSVFM